MNEISPAFSDLTGEHMDMPCWGSEDDIWGGKEKGGERREGRGGKKKEGKGRI